MVTDWWFDFPENYNILRRTLDIIQTRGNFEVDIFDLIDVRGDLPETVRMLSKSQNLPAKQETFPNTSVKLLTPMGLEFKVEGMELSDEIFR
mgnify:FL=1